jgi:putative sigma-54 modulation protein
VDTIVKGRHMEVGAELREYAEEKVNKVAKILNGTVKSVEVELFHERNRSIDKHQVAEVTVFTKGPVIRAREASSDMKAAIDLMAAKLERQARKFKSKTVDRHAGKIGAGAEPAVEEPAAEEVAGPTIVKTKTIDLQPMSNEEAQLQLELLGHDFLLFASTDTGALSVLYRRRDGDYGLLRPSV